jgi:hypothetical protein
MNRDYCQVAIDSQEGVAQTHSRVRHDPKVTAKRDQDLIIEARIRAHVRYQLRERKISQAIAAQRIGIDPGHFSRILKGERGITAGLAYRICQAFLISPVNLFEEDPPRQDWDDDDPRR